MSADENRTRVRRLLEGWGEPAVREVVAPDAVDHHGMPGWPVREVGFREAVERLHRDVPDLRVEVEDVVAEGDQVAVRSTWEGTGGRGAFAFLPADTPFRVPVLDVFRMAEGRVVEHWGLLGQPVSRSEETQDEAGP